LEEIWRGVKVEGALSLEEYFVLVNSLLVPLGEGHTFVHPPISTRHLPFKLTWVSDGLGVSLSSWEGVRPGAQVLSLGGREPQSLLGSLKSFLPHDNAYFLRHRGAKYLSTQFFFQALGLKEEKEGVPLKISWEKDEKLYTVTWQDKPLEEKLPAFSYEISPERSLGFFTLNLCQNTPEYRLEVDRFFLEVKEEGIRYIALDLRRNEGGDSNVVDAFLKYLPPEEIRDYRAETRYAPQVRLQRGDGAEIAISLARLFSRLYKGKRRTPRPPSPDLIFRGQLYVLIGPATFSAGVWVATMLRDNGLCRLIGEPTGGTPSFIGDVLTFPLPHSRLIYTVAHKKFTRPAAELDPAEALYPDIHVPTTIAHLREGRDPQKEKLLDIIR